MLITDKCFCQYVLTAYFFDRKYSYVGGLIVSAVHDRDYCREQLDQPDFLIFGMYCTPMSA